MFAGRSPVGVGSSVHVPVRVPVRVSSVRTKESNR